MPDLYRTAYDRRLAPPPPTGATDLLDRTARQVYMDRTRESQSGTVHKLARADRNPNCGRIYRTRCHRILTAAAGAVLTTREVTCTECQGNRAVPS